MIARQLPVNQGDRHARRHDSFRTRSIAKRASRSGSGSTRMSLLNSIVSRRALEYAVHLGNCGMLGSPVRANATHAALTLVARAYASARLEIRGPPSAMLLKANWISMVCGDR